MKTNNELIADFMNRDWQKETKWIDDEDAPLNKVGQYRKIEVPIDTDDLLYDKSWDALMPVVESILKYKDYIPGSKVSWLIIDVTHSLQYCKIEKTNKYVINFINWYNSQRGGGN